MSIFMRIDQLIIFVYVSFGCLSIYLSSKIFLEIKTASKDFVFILTQYIFLRSDLFLVSSMNIYIHICI